MCARCIGARRGRGARRRTLSQSASCDSEDQMDKNGHNTKGSLLLYTATAADGSQGLNQRKRRMQCSPCVDKFWID